MNHRALTITVAPEGAAPPYGLLLLADPNRTFVDAYLAAGNCYEARCDGQVVGVAVSLPRDNATVELMNIAVHPEWQGQGIGQSLLRHVMEAMAKSGYRTMRVGTGNSSLDQLAFYQKAGFRIVGIVPDYFTRNYAEEIVEHGIVCRDMIQLACPLGEHTSLP